MMKLIITAHAESRNGGGKGGSGGGGRPDKFTRVQARQLANETGVPYKRALSAVKSNANGRAPFTPTRGKNATAASVRASTYKKVGIK